MDWPDYCADMQCAWPTARHHALAADILAAPTPATRDTLASAGISIGVLAWVATQFTEERSAAAIEALGSLAPSSAFMPALMSWWSARRLTLPRAAVFQIRAVLRAAWVENPTAFRAALPTLTALASDARDFSHHLACLIAGHTALLPIDDACQVSRTIAHDEAVRPQDVLADFLRDPRMVTDPTFRAWSVAIASADPAASLAIALLAHLGPYAEEGRALLLRWRETPAFGWVFEALPTAPDAICPLTQAELLELLHADTPSVRAKALRCLGMRTTWAPAASDHTSAGASPRAARRGRDLEAPSARRR